jgi:hypothetical protein
MHYEVTSITFCEILLLVSLPSLAYLSLRAVHRSCLISCLTPLFLGLALALRLSGYELAHTFFVQQSLAGTFSLLRYFPRLGKCLVVAINFEENRL